MVELKASLKVYINCKGLSVTKVEVLLILNTINKQSM